MSGGDHDGKSFLQWLTAGVGLLVAVVTVVGVFVKITPIEIDTTVGVVAVALFTVFLTAAGAAAWSHRQHAAGGWRTALFAALSVAALVGGVLLVIGSTGAMTDSPAAADSPTVGAAAPTTTTSSAGSQGAPRPDGGGPDGGGPGGGPGTDRSAPERSGGGQGAPPHTVPATTTAGGHVPPPVPDDPDSPGDTVRYQGEFRLSAAQESVDLDLDPPQAYGPANELAVDDHALWLVRSNNATGAAASGSPTRAQCVDAVDRANPPAEYFADPRPGDVFCVRTSDGRYALVRVASAGTKDFTLALTVWH